MNTHIKMLLNVSGITKRNDSLTLTKEDKLSANTLKSRQAWAMHRDFQSIDIQKFYQKLICRFGCMSFSCVSIRLR